MNQKLYIPIQGLLKSLIGKPNTKFEIKLKKKQLIFIKMHKFIYFFCKKI